LRIGITCYPTFGGSGVVATELGLALADRGALVHFITYAPPSRLVLHERVRFHEVNVTSYPLFGDFRPYTLALASKMAEVAEFEGLDILHVHYAVPHAISAVLARQILGAKAPKIVTTLHGTDITLVGRDPSYLPITRFGIDSADAVTAVSEWLREETISHIGTHMPIEVIPNFVDPERFRPNRGNAGMFAHGGEKLVCHVSNFRPVKRVLDVVEVFARIVKTVPSRLLMIGDGPERSRAEARCREMHIDGSVDFLGQFPDIEQILGACDLFLLPSENESFGMAALEALASAVPVITTAAGGLPEVVGHGEDGYLLPVGDVDGMAEHAIAILTDGDLHRRLGEAGRRRAVERFDIDRVIPRYAALYERVLAGEPVREV
jgi:L-malate glycosyltransferase